MFNVADVAHAPAAGVKVYVVEPTVVLAMSGGFHVPKTLGLGKVAEVL